MVQADTIKRKQSQTNSSATSTSAEQAEPVKSEDRFELEARIAAGKALRKAAPRKSHAGWRPPDNRRDPIDILEKQNETRLSALVPIRFGRMLQSPFAFFRGSAAVMAADLASTPVSGIRVQACGDCHLSNFGAFATPERNIIFDINDFDETLPAPWEWDLKRLAASFAVAGRNNGLTEMQCREVSRETVRSYRTQMAEFARMRTLDVWYANLDLETILAETKDESWVKRIRVTVEKTRSRTIPEYHFPRMTELKDGKSVIKESPPLIFHSTELFDEQFVMDAIDEYRKAIPEYKRFLFDRYRFYDVAVKVVGVGSVGTVCSVALFMTSDKDPLFLQVKEALASVLEPYAGKSKYAHQGQRVVVGQRLMQSASDIFLAWTTGSGGTGRHYYVRQLRDMKLTPLVETYGAERLFRYAQVTGWTLARAHARSGDAAMLSGYMGKKDVFDQAIEKFAVDYADQVERDHAALVSAVRSGRIETVSEYS